MILVLDYHMGNLANVCRVLKELGGKPRLDNDPALLKKARAVVLPGVGAFGEAMSKLNELKLLHPLRDWPLEGPPLLGICLGMQLLCDTSTEFGRHQGLGLVPGKVIKLPGGVKSPHMGWNQIHKHHTHRLLQGVRNGDYVYFVHGYHAVAKDPAHVLLSTDYGGPVVAGLARGNVAGFQFHPEKSQAVGHRMLKNFVEWVQA